MAAKKTAAPPPAKSTPTDAELAASLRATWDLFRQRLDSPRVRALIPAAADLVDALATALEEPQDKDRALAVAHSCADAIVHVLEGAGPFPLRHDLVQVAHTLDHAILETFGEDREPSDDVHLFKAWSGRAPWKLSKRTNALVYGDLLRRAREGLVRYAPAASVGIGHVAAMAAKNVAYFFAWFDRRPGYPLGATVDKVAAAAAAYKLGLSLRVTDISGSGPQTFDPDHVVYAALEGAGLTADERERMARDWRSAQSKKKKRANSIRGTRPAAAKTSHRLVTERMVSRRKGTPCSSRTSTSEKQPATRESEPESKQARRARRSDCSSSLAPMP